MPLLFTSAKAHPEASPELTAAESPGNVRIAPLAMRLVKVHPGNEENIDEFARTFAELATAIRETTPPA
ncbi:MAG: hypothetical protein ACYDFT_04600 [Thermoplasmata archaeon]